MTTTLPGLAGIALAQHLGARQTDDTTLITYQTAALYIATAGYTEALAQSRPAAAVLDDMCDAIAEIKPEAMPTASKVFGANLKFAKILRDSVVNYLWAFAAIEHTRIDADSEGCDYLFDLLADSLKAGTDPQIIRREAFAAPARIRALAGGAR
ncbi:hypothetical protein ABZX77_17800 [Streptomyces sp. NPDC004237]|uniref:hypothetical protein n=1 Tax=Streptomyces sp. NPDC004237 TaxID=3154455 RepID=UPI0033AB9700